MLAGVYTYLCNNYALVAALEDYPCCKTCKSKVKPVDTLISKCTKCDVMRKTSKCATATPAKIIFDYDPNHTVTMFSNVITKLIDELRVTAWQ